VQSLLQQLDPLFLHEQFVFQSPFPRLHFEEFGFPGGISFERTVLVESTGETGAEVAFDGMTSNVGIEEACFLEDGFDGWGLGGH
jgi:hypothetical protein